MKNENRQWSQLLSSPALPPDMSEADIYRAACLGAVTLLRESEDCEALAEAARKAPSSEIRKRALFSLFSLALQPGEIPFQAIRQLYILAVKYADSGAADFLQKYRLRDADPGWTCAGLLLFKQKNQLLKLDPELRDLSDFFLTADSPLKFRLLRIGEKVLPNWTVFMRFLDNPTETNRNAVLESYGDFSREEKGLIRYCAEADTPISSLPADLVLRYEDSPASELCVKHDLRPSDSSQEALFFFLTEQWERYYAADSDYRRILIAYEENDPELQRRLITAGRKSGNNAWLRHVGGSVESMPRQGTLTDQRLLIESMIEQKQWNRLWDLLPNIPLLCMPTVCDALRKAGFQPSGPDETEFFERLTQNIAACEGLSPIPIGDSFLKCGGTAVSMCAGGPYLAVLFADRRIPVWLRRSPETGPFLISSNRLNFRRAVISHDGKYLCADCGSDGIMVFSLPSGQIVKSIPAAGQNLTGLFLQKESRRLITLYQNGLGIIYTFPGGIELFRFDLGLKDCMRCAFDPKTNHICAAALGGLCRSFDIDRLRPSSEFDLGETPLAMAEYFERGQISVIGQGNTLSSFNLFSGQYLFDKLKPCEESCRRVFSLNSGELYFLGDSAGCIRVFDPVTGTTHAVLSSGNKSPIIGISYDEENAVLYGCTTAGAVRSWDMKLFKDMIRVLPLRDLPGVNRLDEYCKKYPEPGVKAAAEWLKTVAAWRRRFDIEVEFDF